MDAPRKPDPSAVRATLANARSAAEARSIGAARRRQRQIARWIAEMRRLERREGRPG